jgi:NADH:ubiquinone oxidoreductase subunit H
MSETTITLLIVFGVLIGSLSIAAGLIWVERRLLAVWQDRLGPNRVGLDRRCRTAVVLSQVAGTESNLRLRI